MESVTVDFVMTDHPAWYPIPGEKGHRRVFDMPDGNRWLVTVRDESIQCESAVPSDNPPQPDVFTLPAGTCAQVPELATALRSLGAVARFRSVCLWEAIVAVLLQQSFYGVERDEKWVRLALEYGEQITLPDGRIYPAFPSASAVVDALADSFGSAVALGQVRRVIKDAAIAYMDNHDSWGRIGPGDLVLGLQSIPGVGPWSARQITADVHNDFAYYPFDDFRFRPLAAQVAPGHDWKFDSGAFGRDWKHLADGHLSELTALVLAWGHKHDSSTPAGKASS